jgi:hypothetical protein
LAQFVHLEEKSFCETIHPANSENDADWNCKHNEIYNKETIQQTKQ